MQINLIQVGENFTWNGIKEPLISGEDWQKGSYNPFTHCRNIQQKLLCVIYCAWT